MIKKNLIEREIALRGEKVPTLPIPEESYQRFKYKLEEESKENAERNMMIFYIGVGTGYRLQDITSLTIGELIEALEYGSLDKQEQKQLKAWKTYTKNNSNSKRKKPDIRRAEIKKNLEKLIRKYVRGKNKSSYAFPSTTQGGHITSKSYARILTKVGKDLGLKDIAGHSLRKTYAHRLWDETRDLEFVRRALGHRFIETTKLYLGDYAGTCAKAAIITDDRL